MPPDSLVLALDVGTSSARAIAFDSLARAVPGARAQVDLALHADPPGAAEMDADSVVEAIAGCIDSVIAALGDRAASISAVGACTFWHSMVGVDSAGRAVSPLYTWADTRSAGAAEALRMTLNASEVHRRTGCAIHSSYFPARLAWLRRHRREVFNQAARWLSPGEYLYLRLFGRASCSVSMASGTGLYDQNEQAWDSEMLNVSGIQESRLSPLTDVDSPETGLRSEWAERWPILAQIPWTPAVGDGAASNVGSDCTNADSVAVNLGTSGAIRVVCRSDRVDIPPDLWCYRLDRNQFVIGGAFSDGGGVYAWMRRTLQLTLSDDELEAALLGRPPDSHGLTFLPFLAGERSTGWRAERRATLHGLSTSTTPLDIVQASMEGVALRFRLVSELLSGYFPEIERVVASGGAVGASRVWQRMLADALGRPVMVTREAEASSRGAAIIALKCAGLITNESQIPPLPGFEVAPNLESTRLYVSALARQQAIYDRLDSIELQSGPRALDQGMLAI